MAYTIAVAGKGGVGKTTVCGMMIDALIKGGKGPLLVVDADANSNLNEVLGVEAPPPGRNPGGNRTGRNVTKFSHSCGHGQRVTTCKCGWRMPLQRKRILT